jgi:acyl-CoA thioester hydrolase
LRTTVTRKTPVRIEHEYLVLRGKEVLAEGSSTLACVDRSGTLQAMPEWLLEPEKKRED